jgi:hypothetical protein
MTAGVAAVAVVGDAPVDAMPEPAAPYFNPCSAFKLALLTTLTSTFYLPYWVWKHWSIEKTRDAEISPLLRTIFGGIFFYSLARQVKDECDIRDVRCRYSPAILTGLMWAIGFASTLGGASRWLAFFIWIPLMPVQLAINRINRIVAPASVAREGFSKKEIVLAMPLALFWALALIGLMLPPPPVQ